MPTPRPSDDKLPPDDPAAETPGSDEEVAAELEAEGDFRQFIIRRELHKRLDVYLQQRLAGISRSKIQQLIDLGGVTVNGRVPKASTTVARGDVIDVILPAPAIRTIEPENIPLDVLYEDEDFIVINKQAGLIVHPARSHLSGTLVNALAYHFQQQLKQQGREWQTWNTRGFRKQRGDKPPTPPPGTEGAVAGLSGVGAEDYRPGIIHRLDKNTTGVIVVAKRDAAHWQIARQFEERSTIKAYLAVVHGCIEGPGGVIEEPIGKHPTIREAYAVRHDSAGRHAVTIYRVRERYRGYTLVELELKTGRTHQIRVHLSYIGYPLVGDIVYGGEPVGPPELENPPLVAGRRAHVNFAREREEGVALEEAALARKDILLAHPALHAAFLRFVHPRTKQPVTFTAPVHEPLSTLIYLLRQRPSPGPVSPSGYWIDLASALPPSS